MKHPSTQLSHSRSNFVGQIQARKQRDSSSSPLLDLELTGLLPHPHATGPPTSWGRAHVHPAAPANAGLVSPAAPAVAAMVLIAAAAAAAPAPSSAASGGLLQRRIAAAGHALLFVSVLLEVFYRHCAETRPATTDHPPPRPTSTPPASSSCPWPDAVVSY